MHSISSANSFLRPGCTSTPFYSKGARYSVHLSDSSMGDNLKRSNFFQTRPKVFLTCLRWETVSNIYYFWSCFMHTLSSFIFLRPWWTSTPFHSKIARYSVHLSDSSMGDILKTSNFFTDETKNMVLSCSRFETGSIIYYFWSFTMRSKSLSNFFLRPWCVSSPFYSKRGRYSVHLSDSSMGDVLKRSIFITEETKKVVLTSLPLGTAFNIYYFWSFTMHSISSSNFFPAALVHFYSVFF